LVDLGIPLEAAVLFEYGKEEGYLDGKMLLQQVVSKAFPIAEGLYSVLFLFDNATSHSVYSIASKMNKTDSGQQPFLGFAMAIPYIQHQAMWYIQEDPSSGGHA
jgi:hypothetical protein